MPSRGTSGSAGIDFFVPEDFPKSVVFPGSAILIPSGIKAKIPAGHALIGFNKSGVALKRKLAVGACVIDSDYQGEIHLHLFNVGTDPVAISPGEKIAQFLLIPVDHCHIEEHDDIFDSKTERGNGGFGSTDS
jgi:dUTP pyrophosphatase